MSKILKYTLGQHCLSKKTWAMMTPAVICATEGRELTVGPRAMGDPIKYTEQHAIEALPIWHCPGPTANYSSITTFASKKPGVLSLYLCVWAHTLMLACADPHTIVYTVTVTPPATEGCAFYQVLFQAGSAWGHCACNTDFELSHSKISQINSGSVCFSFSCFWKQPAEEFF